MYITDKARRKRYKLWVSLAVALCVASLVCLAVTAALVPAASTAPMVLPLRGKCTVSTRSCFNDDPPLPEDAVNGRSRQVRPLLIKNATVHDGLGGTPRYSQDVLIVRGIIRDIGGSLAHSAAKLRDLQVIDARGRILTPGLVDMHSHMGMGTWPAFRGADDTNEDSAPVYSQGRAIDAFNPQDPSIYLNAAGGITTSLVLPGSADILGGEGIVLKNKPNQLVVSELTFASPGCRWLKMAFGENPTKGGTSNGFPNTRMGAAWLLRKRLSQAQKLSKQQDLHCSRGPTVSDADYPEDLELESLTALLRGQARLNTHVYTVQDIQALFRIGHEFNFSIAALHHATSAHLLADLIVSERNGTLNRDLTMAIFSDKGYYKYEAYFASTQAPSIFKEHKIPFAFKTDHPVTNGQFFAWNAFKSVYYGLNVQDALRAITSIPAKALGVAGLVGSIGLGMHADVLLWSDDLDRIGTRPELVVIDGEIIVNVLSDSEPSSNEKVRPVDVDGFCRALMNFKVGSTATIYFRNLARIHLGNDTELLDAEFMVSIELSKSDAAKGTLTTNNSTIICMGKAGDCFNLASTFDQLVTINTEGGAAMPNAISAFSSLGLTEISQEPATKSGSASPSKYDEITQAGGVGVVDGLEFGRGDRLVSDGAYSKLMDMASLAGVSIALSIPSLDSAADSIVRGVSALINSNAESVDTGGVIVGEVGVHVSLGKQYCKSSSLLGGIQGQLMYLENLFDAAAKSISNPKEEKVSPYVNHFVSILKGLIPLFVHVENAEQISSVLRMKQRIDDAGKTEIKIVIIGGAEAWLVADEIARSSGVSVILNQVLCTPDSQDTKRCRSLSSLENPILLKHDQSPDLRSGVAILKQAGVKFVVALDEDQYARDLVWQAGWARWLASRNIDGTLIKNSREMSLNEAVGLITWDVVKVLNLDSAVKLGNLTRSIRPSLAEVGQEGAWHETPSFVVYGGGHPLETLQSKLLFSISAKNFKVGEALVRCDPRQL